MQLSDHSLSGPACRSEAEPVPSAAAASAAGNGPSQQPSVGVRVVPRASRTTLASSRGRGRGRGMRGGGRGRGRGRSFTAASPASPDQSEEVGVNGSSCLLCVHVSRVGGQGRGEWSSGGGHDSGRAAASLQLPSLRRYIFTQCVQSPALHVVAVSCASMPKCIQTRQPCQHTKHPVYYSCACAG